MRNDIEYQPPCVNGSVPLPEFEPEAAVKLARTGARYIPVAGVAVTRDEDDDDGDGDGPGNNGAGNNGSGNAAGGPAARASHPTGFQECSAGCAERPLRVVCGPDGWFVDKREDYNNAQGWREGAIGENEDLGQAIQRICG
jgi:hypothetical protein